MMHYTPHVGYVGVDNTLPVGGVATYNNIQQSQPVKVCALSTVCGDAQGRLSWLLWFYPTNSLRMR
jgi:hypothetical protein